MERNASAVWKGTLREGTGTMTTESGVLSNTRYSFHTRFIEGNRNQSGRTDCGIIRRLFFHGSR